MCILRPDSHPCTSHCPLRCEVLHTAPWWVDFCTSPSTCHTAHEFAQRPRLTQLLIKHSHVERSNAHSLRRRILSQRARNRNFNQKILDLEAKYGKGAMEVSAHRQEQCVFNADYEKCIRGKLLLCGALELVTEEELLRISKLSTKEFEVVILEQMADNWFFDSEAGFGLDDGGPVDGDGEEFILCSTKASVLGLRRKGPARERRPCDDGDQTVFGEGERRLFNDTSAGEASLDGAGETVAAGHRTNNDRDAWETFVEKAQELPWEELKQERDRHVCYLVFSLEPSRGSASGQ